MSLVGCLTVDKFGRRALLICSFIGTSLVHFIQGFYYYFQNLGYDVSCFSWIPLFSAVAFMIVFGPGAGICPTLMTGEMLAATVKAKALGILNINFAIAIMGSIKVFQGLHALFGMHVPLFAFSACSLVATLFCYRYVPETKGKTLEEIQQALKGNNRANKETDKCNTA